MPFGLPRFLLPQKFSGDCQGAARRQARFPHKRPRPDRSHKTFPGIAKELLPRRGTARCAKGRWGFRERCIQRLHRLLFLCEFWHSPLDSAKTENYNKSVPKRRAREEGPPVGKQRFNRMEE